MLPLVEDIDQRVMNDEGREWYYPADKSKKRKDSFMTLVNSAAVTAKDILTMAGEYLDGKIKRETFAKDYSGYNLDTGLRFQDISSMKEFAPL
ncbi:MAG: phospholipase, partial [Leptospira sp.]|nr:phospholipase [Leptospira sp.]